MAIDLSLNGVDNNAGVNSVSSGGEERLNQLSVSTADDVADMSNNLNITSSLETYKKTCAEKHLGLPFELNISRRRRHTTCDNRKVSNTLNTTAAAAVVHDSSTEDIVRENSSGKVNRRKRKVSNALCFIGWILFFPCCAVGFLMREPPESTDDLDTDPCWPGALISNQNGPASRTR